MSQLQPGPLRPGDRQRVHLPQAATKERLVSEALDAFLQLGFEATTVTELERRIGLAYRTGSFYRHSASKGDLLRVAVEREMPVCMAQVGLDPPLDDGDPPEASRSLLALILRHIRRFDRLVRLKQRDGKNPSEARDAIEAAVRSAGGLTAGRTHRKQSSSHRCSPTSSWKYPEILSDVEENLFLETLAHMAHAGRAARPPRREIPRRVSGYGAARAGIE
jgi:AcrR family transcriptional regulator